MLCQNFKDDTRLFSKNIKYFQFVANLSSKFEIEWPEHIVKSWILLRVEGWYEYGLIGNDQECPQDGHANRHGGLIEYKSDHNTIEHV